jgi:hypothetical protein
MSTVAGGLIMATFDYFLKVDGVAGGSTDARHPNEFVALGYEFDVAALIGSTSSGGGATEGKTTFSPFIVDLAATPGLADLLVNEATGHQIASVTLPWPAETRCGIIDGFCFAQPILRFNDQRTDRRVAHRLDAMAVGVEHERAVIVGVILRPQPRLAVIAAAGSKCRRVKRIDSRAVRCAETKMCPGDWGRYLGFAGNGEFDAKHARRSAVIRSTPCTKIDDAHESERPQGCIVKPATTLEVAHAY